MQPFKLTGTTPDGREAKVWACGLCRHVAVSEEAAERCCSCVYCHKPLDKPRDGYHRECDRQDRERRNQARLDRAKKLEDWDGPVFWGDKVYDSMDEAIEDMDCDLEPEDRPEWLYVAKQSTRPLLNPGQIQDMAYEEFEMCEDEVVLQGIDALLAAVETFNQLNQHCTLYHEDYTRAVRVPRDT